MGARASFSLRETNAVQGKEFASVNANVRVYINLL